MTHRAHPAAALGFALAAAGLVLGGAGVLACGQGHPAVFGDFLPDAGASSSGSSSGGSSSGDAGLIGVGSSGGTPSCPVETQFVYVIDVNGNLLRFDPPTATFTKVAPIACRGSVYSMAVDRQAYAWVLMQSGEIVRVDTRSGACTPTAFKPGQQGFSQQFGMGFSTNGPGSSAETLFVSSAVGATLAQLDLGSLTLHVVGPYDKVQARAEMTGTGDGRLFAAFEGTPYVVAEIAKSTAQVLSQAPQNAVNYPPSSSNFAFAFWGGDFYLFVGPGTSTDVFHYRPSDGVTAKLSTVSFEIVGAGVSTCAPTVPPK
jgi:hypothetical protein